MNKYINYKIQYIKCGVQMINRRKIIDIGNRTVEDVHQIAELQDLPVAIEYNSDDQLAMYLDN